MRLEGSRASASSTGGQSAISSARRSRRDLALLAGVHVPELRRRPVEDHGVAGAERSACFIWPFCARSARSRSAAEPGPAQLGHQGQRRSPVLVVGDDEDAVALGLLLLAEREGDALDPDRPADRRGRRPAELLDQPVVAAAAAQLRTGRRGGRTRTRTRCACSSRGRGPGSGRGRRRRPGLEQVADLPRSARRPRDRGGRAASARPPSPCGCPRRRRRRRAAGWRRSAPAPPPRARPRCARRYSRSSSR